MPVKSDRNPESENRREKVSTHKPQPIWHKGWYRFARCLPSPNFGKRPADTPIDMVVLHSISLPPQQYGTGCVQRFFCNRLDHNAHPYFQTLVGVQVSAHFFVERSGRLWQFVSCDDRAWHAGKSHWRGRDNCNDFSIGIELEGCDSEAFAPAQYETLEALLPAIAQHYPISNWAGHSDIAPQRKTDPGKHFEWKRIRRLLHPHQAHTSLPV